MEVRHPNELTLLVVAPQCAENGLVPVEPGMATSPLVDARRRLDVARGGPPLLVPRLGIAGDQIGRELIDEQKRREPRKQRDSVVERFHMMSTRAAMTASQRSAASTSATSWNSLRR